LPLLRASPDRERLYLDGVHLSEAGHELVGRFLAYRLETLGLVAP
jgi:lysophospholipase L1-like esterase